MPCSPHTDGTRRMLLMLFLFLVLGAHAQQRDTLQVTVIRPGELDTIAAVRKDTLQLEMVNSAKLDTLTAQLPESDFRAANRGRVWTVAGLHAGLYTGSLLLLNETWYKNYPRGSFRFFNDWDEWLQMDKVGHVWSTYQLSRASRASWRWAGLSEKQQVWLGGMSGFAFQTVIEILDGFSEEWGWSWGDFGANLAGSALYIGQELGWREQRVSVKFSFHRMNYDETLLNRRSDELYGSSLPERMLKDYNGQTYWLSANLKSFLPESRLPSWLNVAVGYGATGMFGGRSNIWTDEASGMVFDRSDIARQRQWFLAPDIDFTRIPTRSKWWRSVFFVLNAFKMPAPTLALTGGRLRVYGLYF